MFIKHEYGFEVIELWLPPPIMCLRLPFCRPLYLPLCSLCTIYARAYVHTVVACVCWHRHGYLALPTFTFWAVCVLLNKLCLTCLKLLLFSISQTPKTAFASGIRTSTHHINTQVFQGTPFVNCFTILFTVYKTWSTYLYKVWTMMFKWVPSTVLWFECLPDLMEEGHWPILLVRT